MIENLSRIYCFIFGSIIGSFLNVLIYRIPIKKDFVKQRSFCPNCNKLVKWYENIPILSYLFLLGRCSGCKKKIPIRYPIVELITGIFAFYLFPSNLDLNSLVIFVFYFSVFCCLLVHFFIDVKHQILPDGINIYLAIVFLSYCVIFKPWQHWLFGGLIGFLFPLGITWGFYLLRNKIGLGGGDIKLFGALGIFLGPTGIMMNIFLSCALGSIVGVLLILSKRITRNDPFAFGPFIIITAILQIYFPPVVDFITRSIFATLYT